MLRPYIVIIQDSFHEAFASRVLWILLLIVTGLLLVLAPLGFKANVMTELTEGDIGNWPQLITQLSTADEPSADPSIRRMWSQLEGPVREEIRVLAIATQKHPNLEIAAEHRETVLAVLNDVIRSKDLNDTTSWDGPRLSPEVETLRELAADGLLDQQKRRLNRLLIESAFPQLIQRSPAETVEFRWLMWKLPKFTPISREVMDDSIHLGLSLVMRYFVGIMAVFVAILVTAPIVPQTFTAGSLNLLLSKPLSRSLLFLSKYVGGCAFVLFVSGYMVCGLWLIAGLRFEVWHPRLLLAIPIFAFLFAVYYAVSCLAGVLWKNAILSIVFTVLLWSLLVMVSFTKVLVEGFYIHPFRLTKLIAAGETLVSVNESGMVYAWMESDNAWQLVFGSEKKQGLKSLSNASLRNQMFGPVYYPEGDELIAVPQELGDFSAMGLDTPLAVARSQDQWQRKESETTAPAGVRAIATTWSGEVLLVASEGVFQVTRSLYPEAQTATLFGVELPSSQQNPLMALGTDQSFSFFGENVRFAINRDDGHIAVLQQGEIQIFVPGEDGEYRVKNRFLLGTPEDRVRLSFGGDVLCVAWASGEIEIRDATTGEIRQSHRPAAANQPRFISAAPQGRWFAVTYQHKRLFVVDTEEETILSHGFTGQGNISVAHFTSNGNLNVADRTNRVIAYEMPACQPVKFHAPRQGLLERSYRYGISPLYWMLPKPRELNDTLYYLLTLRETSGMSSDLETAQKSFNPWAPVWSSAGFIFVLLLVSCIHLERSEF